MCWGCFWGDAGFHVVGALFFDLVVRLERSVVSVVPRDGRFPGDPHGRVVWGWGGVGDDNVFCTCTHGRCYATSWDGVGDDNVPCTCTHGRCYATSSFLYLHTWSLLRNIMGWGGVGDDNVPCTCTHGRCYATSSFLYLHTWSLLRNIMGWGGVGWGMITFLALAHMVAATQHQLSCTCTHGRCYATSWDGVGWCGVGGWSL